MWASGLGDPDSVFREWLVGSLPSQSCTLISAVMGLGWPGQRELWHPPARTPMWMMRRPELVAKLGSTVFTAHTVPKSLPLFSQCLSEHHVYPQWQQFCDFLFVISCMSKALLSLYIHFRVWTCIFLKQEAVCSPSLLEESNLRYH